MKTSIDIDQTLLDKALQLSGLPSKKAVVHAALTQYVQMLHQKELVKLRGKLKWSSDH